MSGRWCPRTEDQRRTVCSRLAARTRRGAQERSPPCPISFVNPSSSTASRSSSRPAGSPSRPTAPSSSPTARASSSSPPSAATSGPASTFFPLTCDYVEKTFAAGKIPGGFFKREGRQRDEEILTSRLMDRPLPPALPRGIQERHAGHRDGPLERQGEPDRRPRDDGGAARRSTSRTSRGAGPIAAVRVARIDGEFIAFPTFEQQSAGGHRPRRRVLEGRDRHGRGRRRRGDREPTSSTRSCSRTRRRSPSSSSSSACAPRSASRSARSRRRRSPADVAATRQGARRRGDPRRPRSSRTRRRATTAYKATQDEGRRGADGRARRREASRRSRSSSRKSSRSASTTSSATTCSRERKRIDGRDMKTIRPIVCEVGHPPARARLGALPARRDAGGRDDDARHVERRAEDRRAHGRALEALHAPLQLPAVLDRRDEAAARPGPPRDRPRRPRRARARAHDPGRGASSRTRSASSARSLESNGISSMAASAAARSRLMDAGVPIKSPVAGIAMGLISDGPLTDRRRASPS